MRIILTLAGSLVLAACSTQTTPAWQMGDAEVGHQVARDLCADCHTIERTGDSRNSAAPPLRTVLETYPPEWLATDLHTGQAIAFRKMPVFHFGEGHEYDLVAYLLSIQETRPQQPSIGPATPH
jgi:mono/diheme cytochrome c family protein